MAEHGHVEYATAAGNDYRAHELTYEHFVQHTIVGIIFIVNILLGLATGGVGGHWLAAAAIFVIAFLGVIPGLVGNSKNSSQIAFVLCALIFAYNALSGS